MKNGEGTLALSGQNTYTGNTTVLQGALAFTNSNFGDTSTVSIATGATLALDTGTDVVGALVIGGVSQPGGGFIYTSANTAGAITGNGAIQVGTGGAGGDAFTTWVTGAPYNLTGPNALPGADPDGDGIPNSLEFVTGGNPASGADHGKLPTVTTTGSNLLFTYRLSNLASYLNPAVESSTNLTGWAPAVHGVDGVTISAPTDLGGGIQQIVVTIPKSSNPRMWARLRVAVP